jgi:hypothetical protein
VADVAVSVADGEADTLTQMSLQAITEIEVARAAGIRNVQL